MKKIVMLTYIALLVPLFSQEADPSILPDDARTEDFDRTVPPAPVVTDLRASISETVVSLSWKSPPTPAGGFVILRSDKPISSISWFSAEQRARLSPDSTEWSEAIEPGESWYYAVLSTNPDGGEFGLFIPAGNSLLIPVASGGSAAQVPAVFSSFDVMTRNESVIITWKASVPGKQLVLYRSTAPFTGISDLAQAVVVGSFIDTNMPFVDYPVPGIPFFYAMLDEDLLRSGAISFLDGSNTNRIPVEIPVLYIGLSRKPLPAVRPMPLPWLNPSQSLAREKIVFSTATERMIREIAEMADRQKIKARMPYVFPAEKGPFQGAGEELALRKIIETSFIRSNWEDACAEIETFLSIRRSPEVASRARFYLGQAHYYSGRPEKALLEFLLIRESVYEKSQEWIQYSLELMASSSRNTAAR